MPGFCSINKCLQISGPFQADASEERSLRRQFAYDYQVHHFFPKIALWLRETNFVKKYRKGVYTGLLLSTLYFLI